MANRDLPSPDVLRQLLRYEPDTGRLFWRERDATTIPDRRIRNTWNSRFAGREAGRVSKDPGYVSIRIFGSLYYAHRLAYAISHDATLEDMPEIDHVNGVKTDNRLVNLRLCEPSQNLANRPVMKSNKSGLKGVSLRRPGVWYARIHHNGKAINLGTFGTAEDAHAAYVEAARKIYADFARAS